MSTMQPPWNVMCPDCNGTGERLAPTLIIDRSGNGGTAYAPKKCRPCDGKGWMPVNGKSKTQT